MKSKITRRKGPYRQLLDGARAPASLSKSAFLRGLRKTCTMAGNVRLKCEVESESSSQVYNVRVKFAAPDKVTATTPHIKIRAMVMPVDMNSIQVHCNCDDHKFTFYPWLKANGHSCGYFRPFDGEGSGKRPPRAVDHAGCCKHIAAVLEMVETHVIHQVG